MEERKLLIVRILDNGMARQINPLGDTEPLVLSFRQRWREAESSLRTLPCLTRSAIETIGGADNQTYYAYIDSDTFILLKPAP